MKAGLFLGAALILGTLTPLSAQAQGFAEVLISKHNILPNARNGGVGLANQVCESCHMEDSKSTFPPLWDKSNPARSFPMDYRVPPPTGKGMAETKPFGPSFRCLACHDGVLGNNVHLLGFVGPEARMNPRPVSESGMRVRSPDHPDSILYPRQPDGRLASDNADPRLGRYWAIPDRDENGVTLPTGPKSASLNLQDLDPSDPAAVSELVRTFKGVIHCDTCHNPHNGSIQPFLRVPHKTLCMVCHQR